ncbi:STAS domain-containing protein [Streptomyces sp. NPDC007355]|uniref:STAS domain-containing protein n=1 Tax=Streptomyces sp. NPDC007355 TaxID=3364778 RepID=UPI0036BBB42D
MGAEDLLPTHTVWYRDTAELHLTGELDLVTVPLLLQAAVTALTGRPRHLHLDLSGLTFCDQTGLHAFHRLTHQAHTAHVTLHLTSLHPRLHRTLTPHPPTLPPAPRPPGATDGATPRSAVDSDRPGHSRRPASCARVARTPRARTGLWASVGPGQTPTG